MSSMSENERHLRAYFERLMTSLQSQRFLLQVVFLCETGLLLKYDKL